MGRPGQRNIIKFQQLQQQRQQRAAARPQPRQSQQAAWNMGIDSADNRIVVMLGNIAHVKMTGDEALALARALVKLAERVGTTTPT